jgi:dCTP deaminase
MTVDLRLGSVFGVRTMDKLTHFDPVTFRQSQQAGSRSLLKYYEVIKRVDPVEPFILHPGRFVLGCTLEYVVLPSNISGVLEGRSGWAREGLNVHSTASFIHPGHSGSIVFELSNVGSHPLPLYPGTRLAQIRFTRLRYPNFQPYGSRAEDKYGSTIEFQRVGAPTKGRPATLTATDTRLAMFGRPWQDWEFEKIAGEKQRRDDDLNKKLKG